MYPKRAHSKITAHDKVSIFVMCHATRAHGKDVVPRQVAVQFTFFCRGPAGYTVNLFTVCPRNGSQQKPHLPALVCHMQFAVSSTRQTLCRTYLSLCRVPLAQCKLLVSRSAIWFSGNFFIFIIIYVLINYIWFFV